MNRSRRLGKLVRSAQRHLEPGESVREGVQVQTGQSALATGASVASASQGTAHSSRSGPHVILATDRNVYALRLAGARLLDVGDVVLKVPLATAEAAADGKRKILLEGTTFHVMASWGTHAERLTRYVQDEHADPEPR